MRNWNAGDNSYTSLKEQVFTVPMRNWNLPSDFSQPGRKTGFYSTYEELKQARTVDYAAYTIGFYSTYEELKQFLSSWYRPAHISVFTVPMRNWNYTSTKKSKTIYLCFYSTYEELKLLSQTSPAFSFIQVFTVPMRNWNPQ